MEALVTTAPSQFNLRWGRQCENLTLYINRDACKWDDLDVIPVLWVGARWEPWKREPVGRCYSHLARSAMGPVPSGHPPSGSWIGSARVSDNGAALRATCMAPSSHQLCRGMGYFLLFQISTNPEQIYCRWGRDMSLNGFFRTFWSAKVVWIQHMLNLRHILQLLKHLSNSIHNAIHHSCLTRKEIKSL